MTSQFKTLLLLSLLSGVIICLGGLLGGQQGIIIALILSILMNVGSYWFSDKIVLSMYHARELSENEAPLLHEFIEELAYNANLPKQRIFVVPEKAPNAFATGRNAENSAIAVTEGILQILSPNELKGVLAHEMAHIANKDILIQTIAGVLASTIVTIANMFQFMAIFGNNRNSENNANPFVALLLALLAPIAASLIQMAISRTREYLADETGAKFCKEPLALASALQKLNMANNQIPMKNGNASMEQFFIVTPLFANNPFKNLFCTHPPLEDRIKRLQLLSRNF